MFFIWIFFETNQSTHKPRTIVYIDGFNLYFGALKNTPYKWLDLEKLFQKLLGEKHSITQIKYFTARISPRPGNLDSPERQKLYLKALEHFPLIQIHYGHFFMLIRIVPVASILKFLGNGTVRSRALARAQINCALASARLLTVLMLKKLQNRSYRNYPDKHAKSA